MIQTLLYKSHFLIIEALMEICRRLKLRFAGKNAESVGPEHQVIQLADLIGDMKTQEEPVLKPTQVYPKP